jgi:hypothetical protein
MFVVVHQKNKWRCRPDLSVEKKQKFARSSDMRTSCSDVAFMAIGKMVQNYAIWDSPGTLFQL